MTQQEMMLQRKRYGQYFSGKKVADLLFSLLPENHEWTRVVDPMAGIGDMLATVRDHADNCPCLKLLGVEIDEAVAQKCAELIPEATILRDDAFKNSNLVTKEGFDLVITNPPYVRYQLQGNDNKVMPSAQEIRESLIRQIERIPYLSKDEKNLFLRLAKNYSGLSDMAVPAWLLCAALVKMGGYLAIVVPETWLSRDYAAPIQYLLLKCFRVETVAIDSNASWFPDAQVKTCLVVARRDKMQTLLKPENNYSQIIEIDRSYEQPTMSLFPHLKGAKGAKKWSLPDDVDFFSNSLELPHELTEIVGEYYSIGFVTLQEMEIECGQGLRTGANEFFYVKMEKNSDEKVLVRSKEWDGGGKEYYIEKGDIIPALQNRGEIVGLVVSADELKTAVIYPQGEVHGDLKKYIDSAEHYNDAKGRRFKDYSAVIPNEKKDGNRIVREWFRLPKMANRHLPNLCFTRVSAKIPECLYVKQNEKTPIAIDANMVTLWGHDTRTLLIAFAILNSTWSKLSLELICTVMGGGALKVEASHLKKLLFPKFSDDQLIKLEAIGKELVNGKLMTESIQDRVDNVLALALKNEKATSLMKILLEKKYYERGART